MQSRFICAAALLAASQAVCATTWSLAEVSHAIIPAGEDAVIELFGGSPNSCIPQNAVVDVEGSNIAIDFDPIPDGVACFSAFRPWTYVVTVPGLADGNYDVTVLEDGASIGEFSFDWQAGLDAAAINRDLAPSEGMWWDSTQPGTGVAFNIDDQGRWFAAIYLYDEDGNPSFLTMQGEALAYHLSTNPEEPYAVAVSPLILSEGGQCLKCPWSQATISAAGADAQLLFYSRTRAALVVGSWRLNLTLLPESEEESHANAKPELDRHYSLMVDGPVGRHVLVVKGVPGGPVFTGQTSAALACVDCRSVDEEGQSTEILDKNVQELVEDRMAFLCVASNCAVYLDETAARTFIDKTGTVITALVPGEGENEDTYIELRQLPEGWRE
jgi:hypothetical protein